MTERIVLSPTAPAAPKLSLDSDSSIEAKNMKHLHWEPIKQDTKPGTYWSSLKPDAVEGEDEAMLQEMFGLQQESHGKDHSAMKTRLNVPKLAPSTLVQARSGLHHISKAGEPSATPALSPKIHEEFPTPRSHSPSSSASVQHVIHDGASATPMSIEGTASPPPPKLVISTSIASPPSSSNTAHHARVQPSADRSSASPTASLSSPSSSSRFRRRSSTSSARSSDLLQLPSNTSASSGVTEEEQSSKEPQRRDLDLSRPTKLSLGEMLSRTLRMDDAPGSARPAPLSGTSSTLAPKPQRPDRPKLWAVGPHRPSTPQPPARRLGQKQDVKIDQDLMPNFVFLAKGNQPLKAAVIPAPTSGSLTGGPNSLTRGKSDQPECFKVTPRNMEQAALHAHAAPTEKTGPRAWTFSQPGEKPSATPEVSTLSRPSISRSPKPSILSKSTSPGASALSAAAGSAVPGPIMSPTQMYSPVVLGSGILADIISTTDRVIQSLRETPGSVFVDEAFLLEHVTTHREIYAECLKHEDGEFQMQLMNLKYNSDKPGIENVPMTPGLEVASKILGDKKIQTACPYAPAQWFFDPSNLPLVVQYHLVLQSIDFGLAAAPGVDAPVLTGVDSLTHQPILTHKIQPYTSLDLAHSLSLVLKSNPHAYEAESLTKMDELRLGSWLQPEIFAKALDDHPELVEQADAESMMASPPIGSHQRRTSMQMPTIPWTFPGLKERARILRELGFVLLRFFGGSAVRLVDQADQSAARLVELLTQHLPAMRDASVYHGQFVFFYTRAQCFVRNLWIAFHGTAYGHFDNLSELHGQVDGVLQVIMHHLRLVQYSNELTGWVRNGTDVSLLPSDVEVEMRSATGFVLRRICEILNNLDHPVMEVQLDTWIRKHYRSATHELETFIPNEHGRTKQIVPLIPLHRSSGVWY